MKRKEFIRQLMRDGCVLLRPGAKHDIYINPSIGKISLFQDTQKLITNWQNILENIWDGSSLIITRVLTLKIYTVSNNQISRLKTWPHFPPNF